jgi:4-hydroxythreonine-4-phosphate dehydrogenase
MSCPRIALTSGEPAGIGPDLAVLLAREEANCEIITLGDPELLTARAAQLGVPVIFSHVDPRLPPTPNRKGELKVMPFPTAVPVVTGKPDPKNAAYVLATLDAAIDGCLNRQFDRRW